MNSQTNYIGGVNLDKDRRVLSNQELAYGNDVEFLSTTDQGQDKSAQPLHGSEHLFTIPDLTQQFQYVRLKYDAAATSYIYNFTDSSGNAIGAQPMTIATAGSLVDHIIALNLALAATNYTAALGSQQGDWFSLRLILSGTTPVSFTVTQQEDYGTVTDIVVYTLQEAFDPQNAAEAEFKPVADFQIGSTWFIYSRSDIADQIGYALMDQNGVYTYTTLVITSAFNFPLDEVIEIQGEINNNNQYGLYWCDNTNRNRALYIPTSLGAYSLLKYTASDFETASEGTFTLESIAEQTNLQPQNYCFVNYSSQLQAGGRLEAGTYFYLARTALNKNWPEWGLPSEPFTVFSTSTDSPSAGAVIGGDRSGTVTSKANVLRITNAKAQVFNTIQIACVVNQGGAFSGVIIGEYAITSDEFEITHTGFENTEELDINTLPNVQDIILKSKNLQIKKNILNLANSTIAIDEDITAFDNVTLGQDKAELNNIGRVTNTGNPLFRAGLDTNYARSSAGQQVIALDNATTNGNFNDGSYTLATWQFLVSTTGDYELSTYLRVAPTVSGSGLFLAYLESSYVLNQNTGEKLCFASIGSPPALQQNPAPTVLSNTVTVNLTAGHVLVFYGFYIVFGSNQYGVSAASFTATKVLGDYAQKMLTVGEYERPDYIARYRGYMNNETYQIFAKVLYNNGFNSQWRYVGPYRFDGGDAYASQLNGAIQKFAGTTVGNKAIARALTISGIDVSELKNIAYGIEIGYALTQPTIIGSGIAVASHGLIGGTNGGQYKAGLYSGNTTSTSYGQDINTSNDLRYNANMICTDWILGGAPQFQTGDYLIVYGCGAPSSGGQITGANQVYGGFREFTGYALPLTGVPYTIQIKDAAWCSWNTPGPILHQTTLARYLGASLDNTGTIDTMSTPSMSMALASRLIPVSGTNTALDMGFYMVQYARPSAATFDPTSATVISTNHVIRISPSSPDTLPTETIFGGDVYPQKTYVKILYNALNPDTTKSGTLSSFIGYYSQNRLNTQMRYVDKSFTNLPFPFGTTLDRYLFGAYDSMEQFNLDAGYDSKIPLLDEQSYDPELLKQTNFEPRINYSLEKAVGSLQDYYRVFLPLNFKDMPAGSGPILGLYDCNDVMLCLQPRQVSVLPYKSDVVLSKEDGSIYVGNGGVYAERENVVSMFGPTIKSATLKAENRNGLGQVYWLGANNTQFLRYGYDGVKSLSDENGWRVFFLNNTKFISREFDAVMGFDRKRKSVLITARAVNKAVALWSSLQIYGFGSIVRYANTAKSSNFEQLPDIYTSLSVNSGRNPFDNPSDWQLIPHTDTDYYSEFNVVWNEGLNLFQGQITPLPERYFSFMGLPMAPRGISPYGAIYSLFTGAILQWFEDSGDFKQGTFIVQFAVNAGGLVPISPVGSSILVTEIDYSNYDNSQNPSMTFSNGFQTVSLAPSDLEFENGQIGAGATPDENDEYLISNYYLVQISTQNQIRVLALESTFRIVKPISLK